MKNILLILLVIICSFGLGWYLCDCINNPLHDLNNVSSYVIVIGHDPEMYIHSCRSTSGKRCIITYRDEENFHKARKLAKDAGFQH
jgi:hypothetical protein